MFFFKKKYKTQTYYSLKRNMQCSTANLNSNEKTLTFRKALIAMKKPHMACVLHLNPLVIAHFAADKPM